MKKMILAFVSMAVMLAGCSAVPRASAERPKPTNSPTHRTNHAPHPVYYIGVHERSFPPTWRAVSGFGKATGVPPKLVLWYTGWGRPFPEQSAATVHDHGAIPLIQINPGGVSLEALAAGSYDSYLRSYAAQVRSFGHPVVIGFGHEMNGRWYPWGYGHQSTASFVAAWRHVVTMFRKTGAKNVIWLWTVSHSFPQRYRAYWPGSKYVTWVAIDGYFADPTATFKSIFGRALATVRQFTSRPILLGEAAVGTSTDRQATDIRSLFAGVAQYHLLGLVYYDVDENTPRVKEDWRLERHPDLLRAFRQGVRSLG
jgi:mannan endo-1,4-beta-mannosidase